MNLYRENTKKSIFQIALFNIFIYSAILLPAGTFNIKTILFAIILVSNIGHIIEFVLKKSNLYYSFFMIVFPTILFIISFFSNSDALSLIQYFYVFSYLWLIPVVEYWSIDYRKIFMNAVTLLAVIIVLCAFLDFSGIIPLNANPLMSFIRMHGEGQISVSLYAIFKYVIFLNASPLILISFSYFLFNGKFLLTVISFLGLAFSGTRANIYLSFVLIGLFVLFNNKNILVKIGLGIVSFVIMIRFFQTAIDKILLISWAKSDGDNIRNLTLESIFRQMDGKFSNYLFGMGARTFYFNFGRGIQVNESELTYLELLRQVGLIGLIPFLVFLLRPLVNMIKISGYKWLVFGYLLYLIKCFFDPFLFTSTGFMLLVLVFTERRKIDRFNYGIGE